MVFRFGLITINRVGVGRPKGRSSQCGWSGCVEDRVDGQSYCRTHIREYRKAWNVTTAGRSYNRRNKGRKYGMSAEEHDEAIRRPCDICGEYYEPIEVSGKTRAMMRIDHDHITGVIRGTLCHTCNVGLGNFRDSIELLRSAEEYLNRSNA